MKEKMTSYARVDEVRLAGWLTGWGRNSRATMGKGKSEATMKHQALTSPTGYLAVS